jgi:hypothetical protein
MRIVYLTILLLYMAKVESFKYEGSTQIDIAVTSYLQLEKNIWEKYVNGETSLSLHERIYKILNQHYVYVMQYIQPTNVDDKDFKILEKFYEWKSIEHDVKSIHDLFKNSFLRQLENQLKNDVEEISAVDQRALLDLSETVLFDNLWPVNATIEKMQNSVYNQGLFYKANSVCFLLSLSF